MPITLEHPTKDNVKEIDAPHGVYFIVNKIQYWIKEDRDGGIVINKYDPENGKDLITIHPGVSNQILVK